MFLLLVFNERLSSLCFSEPGFQFCMRLITN